MQVWTRGSPCGTDGGNNLAFFNKFACIDKNILAVGITAYESIDVANIYNSAISIPGAVTNHYTICDG